MENGSAQLDVFRSLYCGSLALVTGVQLAAHQRFLRRAGVERTLPRLFGRLAMPRLSPSESGWMGLATAATLAAAAAGWAPAATLGGASVLALVYYSQVIEFPTVRRKTGNALVILPLLAAAALAAPDSTGEISRACLLTIKLVVAQMYFSSGLAKVRSGGWGWSDGETLRAWMIDYYFFHRRRVALHLASSLGWCRVVSLGLLVFELSFWLVIPFPALAWCYVPLGIAFHAGTAIAMRIHYWIYVVPAYLIFLLPWLEKIWNGR